MFKLESEFKSFLSTTDTFKVALSIREKLQVPEGWWSSGFKAKEYTLIPSAGVLLKCW